jgi:acetoin utilization deacetylase AcuC-like enzyme
MEPPVVVTSPAHVRHDPPYELNAGRVVSPVWERPARLDAVGEALFAAGLASAAPRPHADDAITAVHDPAMVAWLRDAHHRWVEAGGPPVVVPDTFALRSWSTARYPDSPLGQAGWWCTDTATPLVAGTWPAVRAAVDAALTAADLVAAGQAAAYALVRPPGHHAGRDHFGGFCVLNLAAIASQALTAGGRVAVLDLDYHHGNGTQEIFWRRDDVLYVSVHADPATAYPYLTGRADEVGEGRGRGTTVNLPLPPSTDAAGYLTALREACERISAWGPTSLVVSLGFDTARTDPIAGLGLDVDAFTGVGTAVSSLGLPTVVVQEGGYDLASLGACATAFVTGLIG